MEEKLKHNLKFRTSIGEHPALFLHTFLFNYGHSATTALKVMVIAGTCQGPDYKILFADVSVLPTL